MDTCLLCNRVFYSFSDRKLCHDCGATHHTCYDCGALCVSAECANGTRCDLCWFTDISTWRSSPEEPSRFQGPRMRRMSIDATERLFDQLARRTCPECGGHFNPRTNALDDKRFFYVWCDTRGDRHQYVAFVDHHGNIVELYQDTPWRWSAGGWRDPAQFEPWIDDQEVDEGIVWSDDD